MTTKFDCDPMEARILSGEFGEAKEKNSKPSKNVQEEDLHKREVIFRKASSFEMKPVHWLWEQRIPQGGLTLLAGDPDLGKSTVSLDLAAALTRGKLPGRYHGKPKPVLIVASEDSWEHTIVPRLRAADADLDLVFTCTVLKEDLLTTEISLPIDIPQLKERVLEADVKMVILDPLLSRLGARLDSHKDAEVRLALEPLVRFAEEVDVAILGLIHMNKSSGQKDPLKSIMASIAIPALARSVLAAVPDSEIPTQRVLGRIKGNLAKDADAPLAYTIEGRVVGMLKTDEGEEEISAGRIKWLGESEQSIREVFDTNADPESYGMTVTEIAMWLEDYLTQKGKGVSASEVQKAALAAGYRSRGSLYKAKKKIGVRSMMVGFPRESYWELPEQAEKPF